MLEPIKLFGNWEDGYALDNHMLSSEFLGYDENGKEKFNNIRTEVGELIYQIKYNKRKEKINDLLNLMIDDLYSTGATLNEITKILKSDINVKNIYVLVMTKTRR